MSPEASRQIFQEDAIGWLRHRGPLSGASVITSLPDLSEVPGYSLESWEAWFSQTAGLIVERTPPEGAALFYQTDIKRAGRWVDKGYLVHRGAEAAGGRLLWHKIVCRVAAGQVTFGRPAFAHLMAFSRGLNAHPGKSTADVLPELGEMTWARAMPLNACELACRYVRDHTPTRTVVDPFCGLGTVLAVANSMGLDAIGVELSAKRARRAQRLRFDGRQFAPDFRGK